LINKENEKLICKKAVNTFGEHSQMIKCVEECSELQRAIARTILDQPIGNVKPRDNFNEELADVEIMLQQMKQVTYFDKKLFDFFKEEKLKRLERNVW
jgi:NTP pyrophosphatase (non-canonical NTP hydrolase)